MKLNSKQTPVPNKSGVLISHSAGDSN